MSKTIEYDLALKGTESVIPAIPGEFYSYSARFTDLSPVYTLVKCKSNKSWPKALIQELGAECSLIFELSKHPACAYSIRNAYSKGLFNHPDTEGAFDETFIAPARIGSETFYEIFSKKNSGLLVRIAEDACRDRDTSVILESQRVYACATGSGKYGLFFTKELMPSSLEIDACHILL